MIMDDLHWLDHSSARVLAFVLRRLPPAPVSFLASVRTGWAGGQPVLATDAIPPGRLDRLVLGPLSLGRRARTGHVPDPLPAGPAERW